VSIGVVLAVLAVLAGVMTSLVAPVAVAVAVAVAAGAAGQTVRPRLEHLADRWVLGARLAGYASLSRFGESLTRVPGSAALLRDLAGEIRRGPGPDLDPGVAGTALKDLTPRELDVLREMAQGRGNAGIAAQLYLSESSVEKHVNAIFTKLGLSAEQLSHRRVTVVLTFLRDAGLRG
jgi:DNA-binding CsgD family transcriptional regulator